MSLPIVTKKLHCATRKCVGVVATDAATAATSHDGYWQFHCSLCNYWNLASPSDTIQATSPTPFDLGRLPPSVRSLSQIKRSPPGGV